MSRIDLSIDPAFSDAAIVAATPALPQAPSWSVPYAHADLGMVLGVLLGHESDAWHASHPVPTATRIVAL
jgi:hypothetical protein